MKIYQTFVIMAIMIFMSGCENFVEVSAPENFLISSEIFESDETAISATTGIYASMMNRDYPISYNIAFLTGLYADDLEYNQSVLGILSVYKNTLNPQDALTNGFWNNGFNYIYQSNALIEGLNNSNNISPAVKKQLLGEAKFLRAFWYYYLVNLYGPLPEIKSTDYKYNIRLPRTSEETIQKMIIDDLLQAKDLLSTKYLGANTITEVTDRLRPNTFVASALLSKVYLQRKEYKKAEEETSRIISNTLYDLVDLPLVYKRTSKEVIWQLELPSTTSNNNSYEANYFALTTKPNISSTTRSSTLSVDLLSLFIAKDKRKTAWIGTYTDNTVSPAVRYNFPSKLKSTAAPADEYTTTFRLAEIYLIRAEARAQLGLTADAINDTDKIRSRAGLDLLINITPTINSRSLLDSIRNEKRRELFCEWGVRWLDIRRAVNPDEIMSKIAAKKGVMWKPFAKLWPLPLNEVINSANILKQNEGYD